VADVTKRPIGPVKFDDYLLLQGKNAGLGDEHRARVVDVCKSLLLACSGVQVSVTGTLDETALSVIDIPDGAMGPNSALKLIFSSTWTDSANSKTGAVRIGQTIAAPTIRSYARTTTTTAKQDFPLILLHNRGSLTSQFDISATSFGTNVTTAPAERSINFGQTGNKIFITGRVTAIAESFTLNSVYAEIINPYL
jgi:hypothetical protein